MPSICKGLKRQALSVEYCWCFLFKMKGKPAFQVTFLFILTSLSYDVSSRIHVLEVRNWEIRAYYHFTRKKKKIASLASNERDNSKDKTANSCSRILNSKSSDMERVRVGRENNGTVYSLMALIE